MSSHAHKVLLAIRNPFIKTYPYQGSKPCFVWLTRDEYADGRNGGGPIGTQYLLLLYGLKGTVKYHFELNVLNRMHRA